MYPRQLLQHFEKPYNAGALAPPAVCGRAENPGCGDVMVLWLRADSGVVIAASFQAQGCVATMAAGSALTTLLQGSTLQQARQLRREALVEELGGLSPESMHASHLAMDALSAALKSLPL